MKSAIIEILRLVAEGSIRPEEGRELLEALRGGYPEEFDRPTEVNSPESTASVPPVGHRPPRTESLTGEVGIAPDPGGGMTDRSVHETAVPIVSSSAAVGVDGIGLGAGAGSSDTEGRTDDADPRPPPDPPASDQPTIPPDPHPADSGETDDGPRASDSSQQQRATSFLGAGHTADTPPGILLQIGLTSPPSGADGSLSSIAIRGVDGQTIRVVRGTGVELTREDAVWRLTWPGGMLFLEVPTRLGGLEVSGIPGSVGLSGYAGPFSAEEIGGGLTVHEPSAPFRVRDIRGAVRLLGLALRDGISTITTVARDVEIETAREASVTIRATSRPGAHEGGLGLDAGGEMAPDRGGRRGVWRVGAGTAQLSISQVRGQLRLHPAEGTTKETP